MLRRILIRTGVGCLTLFAVTTVIFFSVQTLPGDPAQAYLGKNATPQLLRQYRHAWGLDRPLLTRYGDWLWGFVHGDLGVSLPSGNPVMSGLHDKLRNTAGLALATLIVLIPLSLLLGVLSAVKRDRPLDHLLSSFTLSALAVPEFVTGTLLALVIGVSLGWLPPVSFVNATVPITSQLKLLILPLLTLVAAALGQSVRMVRATMIVLLDSVYVQMARLKGAPSWRVLWLHALPNALPPILQVFAFITGWLVGGIVVVESVFQYPGLGSALTSAVNLRDSGTVEAITLIVTGVFVVVNLLADVGVILLNPKLRRSA